MQHVRREAFKPSSQNWAYKRGWPNQAILTMTMAIGVNKVLMVMIMKILTVTTQRDINDDA